MPTFPLRHEKLVLMFVVAVSVCALLVATLWPLNPWPKNEVSWLQYEDGVRLCKLGTIFSVGQFSSAVDAETQPFSLEVWMEPWRDEGSTVILAFYEPEHPAQFILRQDGLAVAALHANGKRGEENPESLDSGEVIETKRTLVTVTAGPYGTTLYVNGQARRFSRAFRLSRKNLTGELVIGTSPVASKCWCGILRGIAIYGNELTAQEVSSHYKTWSLNRGEGIQSMRSMLALYLFRERSGSLVKNEIQPGVNLSIPKYYTLWRQAFLLPPWKEFSPEWAYVNDLSRNVLGFVPLGLILYPCFLVVSGSKRPWLMSCVAGAVLSLLIEILQSFLPERSSGWTDVITNSAGTAVGASIYFSSAGQGVLKKLFGESLKASGRDGSDGRYGS
jgi:VanZ family protein